MNTNLSSAICAVAHIPTSEKGGRLQRCYDEVYLPAIADAGLIADTLSLDCAVSPALIDRIAAADALFADITEDHPILWLVLGCAVTLHKPLCLVVSEGVSDETGLAGARAPLHLFPSAISYPLCLLPSDYAALRQSIMDSLGSISHLRVARLSSEALQAGQPLGSSPDGLNGPPAQEMLNKEPSLSPYEIMALALIAKDTAPEGMGVGKLAQNMHKFGLVRATSLAVNSLRRKHCVTRHAIPSERHGLTVDREGLSVTPIGQEWLSTHAGSIEHAFSSNLPAEEPTDLMDYLATLRFRN